MKIALLILLLLVVIVFFQYVPIDAIIQDYLYNFDSHEWMLGKRTNPVLHFVLYTGMKKALVAFGIGILILLLFFRKNLIVQNYFDGLLIVFLSLAIATSISSGLKSYTNMPCPSQTIKYGGELPEKKIWEKYQDKLARLHKLKCYPAGHASGGFALMSLFFLFKKRSNKRKGFMVGFGLGWITGLYKMAIGDHFLQHTIVTMLLVWIIILIIAKIVNCRGLRA